jgi:hypothetical protein
MGLNYRDAGYGDLKELYGKAVAEMFEGRNAYNRAVIEMEAAGGQAGEAKNRALALYGRAASLYTRAQAHAREVYEALAPAPTSPVDLGLRPFGDPWATWETRVGRAR